jgi:PAS domain S-box-containing protein
VEGSFVIRKKYEHGHSVVVWAVSDMSKEPQNKANKGRSEAPVQNTALQLCENDPVMRSEQQHPKVLNNCAQDGANRKATSAGSLGEDIIKHQRMEEALRHSEEDFRSIFENAPVGIYQSTVDRLLTVNPAMARMFGFESPAEMLARTADPNALYVQPEQRRKLILEVMETEAYVQQEVEYRRKDASSFAASLRMRAIRDKAGKIQFVEGFVEDLTERKRAATALRL